MFYYQQPPVVMPSAGQRPSVGGMQANGSLAAAPGKALQQNVPAKPAVVRGQAPQEAAKPVAAAPVLPSPEQLGIGTLPPSPEQLGIGATAVRR
jgi:hypothetical protein